MTALKRPRILTRDISSTPGKYNFDSGCVAFTDPLEVIRMREAKREAERQRESKMNKTKRKATHTGPNKDFHLKHG